MYVTALNGLPLGELNMIVGQLQEELAALAPAPALKLSE